MLAHSLALASELNLVTSSIAAVIAHAMGNPGLDASDTRGAAVLLLADWLQTTEHEIASQYELVDFGHDNLPKRTFTKLAPSGRTGKLRLAALPLDGASSLYRGRAGVMTWLALMGEAAFERTSVFVEADSYFVLTFPSGEVFADARKTLNALDGHQVVATRTTLVDYMKGPTLAALLPQTGLLAAHTMEAAAFRDGRPTIGKHNLGRSLDGSAVVSSIGPHTGRTDFGYCVCRGPGVPIIGAITKAAGGAALAFRIRQTGSPPMQKVSIPASSKYIATDSLFTDKDHVILCGASISEICVSDRVRWWSDSQWRPVGLAQGGVRADTAGCHSPHLSISSLTFDTLRQTFEERCCHWDTRKILWSRRGPGNAVERLPLSEVIQEYRMQWEQMFNDEMGVAPAGGH